MKNGYDARQRQIISNDVLGAWILCAFLIGLTALVSVFGTDLLIEEDDSVGIDVVLGDDRDR